MRRAALLFALSVLGTAACAALGSARGSSDPRAQLAEGVAAVQAQQYLRARGLLEPLFYQRYSEPVGQQAMLVLIAAEIDNRNPDRRLWAAADMAGRLINLPGAEPWVVPVAESYYLLAMELGAAEERIAQAESRADRADRRLPQPASESVPARVSRITSERDQARRRAEQAEQQLAVRERELRETRQELERIKRTIRP